MPRPRLIPLLLLKHGLLVRSQAFVRHQVIGNPLSTIQRFSNWQIDELILLDISEEDRHDLRRDDRHQQYRGSSLLDVLRETVELCHMPLTVGGRVGSLAAIERRLELGADKVAINSAAVADPAFVSAAASRFGSQAIVASIDVRERAEGGWRVYSERGRKDSGLSPEIWARELQERGAGEILLNSIDRDGSGRGYDIDLIAAVSDSVSLPVIACGGVGRFEHLPPGIFEGGASAVAAANIFHFYELSYPLARKHCLEAGLAMRPVSLSSLWSPREPEYERAAEDQRLGERLSRAREPARDADTPPQQPPPPVRWCTRCVYPSVSAAPMEFDDAGVCMGCRMAEVRDQFSSREWARRRDLLGELLERARSRNGARPDLVIAVSGGKDSYYQTHVIVEEFGLRPLLVTYDTNNWTEAGWRNMIRMREVFDCDHIVYRPPAAVLRKLNRLGFLAMGDMSWHAHVGITTVPVQIATQMKIPLVLWGEHGYLDLSGQFSMDDYPEMNYRDRLEHFGRGFEWNYFLGREGLTSQQLAPWKYPSDRELYEVGVKGLYLGNYLRWDANEHVKLVTERYGWEVNSEPFDRTYRCMSNLDDMHENGVHDYLKYVKFGYGRCTDHASKDIRSGRLSREEALELVRRYDPVRPRDLSRWLSYVDVSEAEFDAIADTFRDPRVWWRENGRWVKDEPWTDRKPVRLRSI